MEDARTKLSSGVKEVGSNLGCEFNVVEELLMQRLEKEITFGK